MAAGNFKKIACIGASLLGLGGLFDFPASAEGFKLGFNETIVKGKLGAISLGVRGAVFPKRDSDGKFFGLDYQVGTAGVLIANPFKLFSFYNFGLENSYEFKLNLNLGDFDLRAGYGANILDKGRNDFLQFGAMYGATGNYGANLSGQIFRKPFDSALCFDENFSFWAFPLNSVFLEFGKEGRDLRAMAGVPFGSIFSMGGLVAGYYNVSKQVGVEGLFHNYFFAPFPDWLKFSRKGLFNIFNDDTFFGRNSNIVPNAPLYSASNVEAGYFRGSGFSSNWDFEFRDWLAKGAMIQHFEFLPFFNDAHLGLLGMLKGNGSLVEKGYGFEFGVNSKDLHFNAELVFGDFPEAAIGLNKMF